MCHDNYKKGVRWFKFHCDLFDDERVQQLADKLSVSYQEALGLASLFWAWQTENLQLSGRGEMSAYNFSFVFRRFLRFDGDAQRLFDALVSSGFLRVTKNKEVFAVDFLPLQWSRIKEAERQQERRENARIAAEEKDRQRVRARLEAEKNARR